MVEVARRCGGGGVAMKLVTLAMLLALVAAVSVGTAAVPQTMSYQGVLRDASGVPVPDGVYQVTFRIYDVGSGGTALWSEIQTVSVEDGIINAILGTMTALTLPFDTQYWLGISVEGEAELTPRTALAAAPYALNAAGDGDWTVLAGNVYRSTGNVGVGIAAPTHRIGVHSNGNLIASAQFTNDVTGSTYNDGLVMGVDSLGIPYVMSYEAVPGLSLGAGGTEFVRIQPSGVQIHNNTSIYGNLHVDSFDMDTGAVDGYVLTTDATGNGTWQPAGAGGDDGDWTISGPNVYRASGNVGIGTTTPAASLHVNGTVFVPYTGAYSVGSVGYKGLWWDSGTGSVALGNSITSLALFSGNSLARAVLWENGDLGIGLGHAVTPDARVHVESDSIDAVYAKCTHNTQVDYIAVRGNSEPVDYYGLGGDFEGDWIGVEGFVLPSVTGSHYYYAGYFGAEGGIGTNYGVYGHASGEGTNYAIFGDANGYDYAGYFSGNVQVDGTLTYGSLRSKIDHPLDPGNMYLNQNAVESDEMKTIYDGVVELGADGAAWVEMPEWFDALNAELRYQLTCVGGYAPVYVAEEVRDNRFMIAGGTPGLKVCWQVTGVRQDAFARANSMPVEEMKPLNERGLYLHPTALGFSKELTPVQRARDEFQRKAEAAGLDAASRR
jgi:hypothetical protein